MSCGWDPDQYARYRAYRERPADDLLAQIPDDLDAHEIWDLGCGLGEQAVALKRRFPQARMHGLDSSASMLAKARAHGDPSIDWVEADIASWSPAGAPDLIFSNAALHWLPDHATLFARLMTVLKPGGVFACQMPVSYDAPQHVTLRETAADGPWAEKLAGDRRGEAAGQARRLLRLARAAIGGRRDLVHHLSPRAGGRRSGLRVDAGIGRAALSGGPG